MNRIRIDLPASLPFATSIPLRITDINYGNHLGNHVFAELMHEARVQFLANMGFAELNFAGASLIMSDLAVEFKSEICYGDQVMVQVGISSIHRAGFDLVYVINSNRNGDMFLAARAKTGMICFDYNQKKVIALPSVAAEKLRKYLI